MPFSLGARREVGCPIFAVANVGDAQTAFATGIRMMIRTMFHTMIRTTLRANASCDQKSKFSPGRSNAVASISAAHSASSFFTWLTRWLTR